MRKIIIFIMVLALVMGPSSVLASNPSEPGLVSSFHTRSFADMPKDWSTEALNAAVDNGLLSGYDTPAGKMIRPEGTLTRAELAAVLNRAFGAKDKADVSTVSDLSPQSWYYPDMAKAVAMGTFALDKKMRPNDPVTRQEVMAVLVRAFQIPPSLMALNSFSDSSHVSSWAKGSATTMVESGYVSGSGGRLAPRDTITRAEFAQIMHNMVNTYYNKAGTYSTQPVKGNVLISAPGVTLTGVVQGDLILAEGIGDGQIDISRLIVEGRIVVRCGDEYMT